ncbi:Translation machinery-associated protein 22 [Irineochytrium annulatum]|nr:Translation machinery-associated protein 22 [Irineochytrium annulatum]
MSDDGETPVEGPVATTRVLDGILYCAGEADLRFLGAPPEYCAWGPSEKRCKAWLKDNHPKLFEKYWPGASLEAAVEAVSLGDGAEGEAKPGAKPKMDAAEKAELKEKKKREASRVIIKRVERSKRKCVISISGLENFGKGAACRIKEGVDLKKAAKTFATKFATGSSVTKNPAGIDEIVIQGDVQDEVCDMIMELWPQVPEDNIDLVAK